MSSFTKKLTLTQIGGKLWRNERQFEYHAGQENSKERVVVPKGFITDGASIPRFFWRLVGHPLSEYAQAAVLHDYLYNKRFYPRKRNDQIFYEAMGVLGVWKWKRMLMYQAVRRFGWIPWNSKNANKR